MKAAIRKSVAGPAAPIPSAALRAARLQIVGSGQGSVGAREILAELPALAREITNGKLDIDARPVPLSDVEQAWADAAHTTQRIVLTPQPLTRPGQPAPNPGPGPRSAALEPGSRDRVTPGIVPGPGARQAMRSSSARSSPDRVSAAPATFSRR